MFTREDDMKCCFIGSRLIDEWSMTQRIFYLLFNEKIYEHGFNEFVMGQRGSFDRATLNACRKFRKIYPDIKIKVAMKSYHAFMKDEDGHTEAKDYYGDVDTFIYDVSGVYYKDKIIQANKQMIDESDLIICFANLNDITSGARKGVLYAKKRNKKIINLFNQF